MNTPFATPYPHLAAGGLVARNGAGADLTLSRQPQFDPYWSLVDPTTAFEIVQRCIPAWSVITLRQNTMVTHRPKIETLKEAEERISAYLFNLKDIFSEFGDATLPHAGLRTRIYLEIAKYLGPHMVRPDLTNFNKAHNRWFQEIQQQKFDHSQAALEYFENPAPGKTWAEFVKQFVMDFLVVGRAGVWMETFGGPAPRYGNFHMFPSGTLYRVGPVRLGEPDAYVQIVQDFSGLPVEEPLLFEEHEVLYEELVSVSSAGVPMTPINAFVNLALERMLSEKQRLKYADGSKKVQKVLAIGQPGQKPADFVTSRAPGAYENAGPPKTDVRRITLKVNEQTEDDVAVIDSTGNIQVIDLTRADLLDYFSTRDDAIQREAGRCWWATPMEMGLAGSDDTSGRSTSEAQERIALAAGTAPIVVALESAMNTAARRKFGNGLVFSLEMERTEREIAELMKLEKGTGVLAVNDILRKHGLRVYDDERFDLPDGGQSDGAALVDAVNGIGG